MSTFQINRLEGEDFLDYKLRLIAAKLEREIDLDWSEIKDLLSLDCSADHLRKTAYGIYEYKGHFEDKLKNNAHEDVIKEIEEKNRELQISKYQFQDQRKEYNKLVREQAKINHLKEEMVKEVKSLSKEKPLEWYDRTIYPNIDDVESLLVLSDTHYGLFTSNYWNHFDNEEFKRRLKKLVTKTITHSKIHNVKALHLFLLGDLINGLIHQITRIVNTEDAVSQTMRVSEMLSEVIVELANEFEIVKLYNVRGNHDRVTPNKKDEIAKESFNDLVPWYLKARLSHVNNLEFMENKYDDEIIVTEIAGNKVFGVHGHKDKVNNVTHNLTMMTKEFPDYIVMGHTHHHEENEDHQVEVIVNSSFSGVDDYAKDIRKTSKPAQKLIIFNKEDKRLCTYNILLGN